MRRLDGMKYPSVDFPVPKWYRESSKPKSSCRFLPLFGVYFGENVYLKIPRRILHNTSERILEMTSIKAVARQAGVSIATVSRVVNGSKYVSPDITKRVLDAIEALKYAPNMPAQSLRRRQTLSIGILMPLLNDVFLNNLAYILEKQLSAAGYSPLFCSTENDEEKEMDCVRHLISHRVDGVIMMPSAPVRKSARSVERLLERHIPLVVVDRTLPDFNVNQVCSNNARSE